MDPRNPAGTAEGIPVTGPRLVLRPLRPEEIDEQWQAMVTADSMGIGQVPDEARFRARLRRSGQLTGGWIDLADRLRTRGWQVPAYTLTGTASDIPVPRILVRLGVSRDMAALLLDDFRDAVAHFTKHPVTVSMTKEESGGFSHL